MRMLGRRWAAGGAVPPGAVVDVHGGVVILDPCMQRRLEAHSRLRLLDVPERRVPSVLGIRVMRVGKL